MSPSSRFECLRLAIISWCCVLGPDLAYAEAGASIEPADCTPQNHPPGAIRLAPQRNEEGPLRVRAMQPHQLVAIAADPDGDPLRWSLVSAPDGVSFSEQSQRLAWTPTREQLGEQVVVLRVSDGERETTRAIEYVVYDNHPPRFFMRSYQLTVGQRAELKFWARDADGDTLEFSLERGPADATFDSSTGVLSWRPSANAVGTEELVVSVSDGTSKISEKFQVEVSSGESASWTRFFVPETGAMLYAPRGRGAGTFLGGMLGINWISWLHPTSEPGPSHGRVYARAGLAQSSEPEVDPLFSYALGFSLSMERNPKRSYLIPTYGLEFGGLVHRSLGNPFSTTPLAGLVLYAQPGLSCSAQLGYRLVPARLAELNGLMGLLALDLAVW